MELNVAIRDFQIQLLSELPERYLLYRRFYLQLSILNPFGITICYLLYAIFLMMNNDDYTTLFIIRHYTFIIKSLHLLFFYIKYNFYLK
jgi:hypothetical protein